MNFSTTQQNSSLLLAALSIKSMIDENLAYSKKKSIEMDNNAFLKLIDFHQIVEDYKLNNKAAL